MNIEVAEVMIKPGMNADFEATVNRAVDVFRQAKGCLVLPIQKCVEEPERYQAIIGWEPLVDQTGGLREASHFQEWRGFVGPFFAEPPNVLHYEKVMDRAAFSEMLQ